REYQLSPRRRVSHDITYKKGWGILAGRDAGATKSFPPPFHLLPLTVCLLPPRDSTELTTAVSPTRLSFRGPTFSVGPRNLSERSLARRVRLGMTGQKKLASSWQAAASPARKWPRGWRPWDPFPDGQRYPVPAKWSRSGSSWGCRNRFR